MRRPRALRYMTSRLSGAPLQIAYRCLRQALALLSRQQSQRL
jgi:hypothetical protein